jgi:hypothetical protein
MNNTTKEYNVGERLTSLGYSVSTLRIVKKLAAEFKDTNDLQALKEALKEIEYQANDALTFDKNNGGIEK